MSIETLLQEEITDELEQLHKMELGSDQYRGTVEGITKLMDRAIEMERFDLERRDKIEGRQEENDLKLRELNDERINRLTQNAIAAVGIIVPTAVTIWGTIKSIEFEKEGTITTIMGRGFINKLLPKK